MQESDRRNDRGRDVSIRKHRRLHRRSFSLLYTDGLVEVGEEPQPWVSGKDALLPVVDRLRNVPLAELPEAIVAEMGAGDKADDDVAVLAVEV